MMNKEVLAKVNKLVALALTKHRAKVELSANQCGVNVGVHQFVDTDEGIKVCGDVGFGGHYVYLEEPNALSKLNKQIAWIKGLENRHD